MEKQKIIDCKIALILIIGILMEIGLAIIYWGSQKHTCPPCTTTALSFEAFGAIGADSTFRQKGKTQEYVDSLYPGINASIDDNIDWAAINYAVLTTKKLFAFRKSYYINKPIYIPNDFKGNVSIDGNMDTLFMVNKNAEAVFLRQQPTSLAMAEIMANNFSYSLKNMVIVCHKEAKTDGIKLGASTNFNLCRLKVYNCNTAIIIQSSINGRIDQIELVNCSRGIMFASYNLTDGYRPCSTINFNIAMEQIVFNTNKSESSESCNPVDAIILQSANQTTIKKLIVTGYGPMRSAINIQATGCVLNKALNIEDVYVECFTGFTDAVIKVTNFNDHLNINGIQSMYPSLLVKAEGISGAGGVVVLKNIRWAVPDKITKKLFYNENYGWIFINPINDIFEGNKLTTKAIQEPFAGIIPSIVCKDNYSENKLYWQNYITGGCNRATVLF